MNAQALLAALAPERASFVRLARRRLGGRAEADAEDVVQRALLQASAHAASLEDPARARAWFYRILRNTIADHHRSRGPAAEALEEEPAATEEPVTHACACAPRLIAELRPPYAEVLRAVDVEARAPEDVAAGLGISVGNLHVRLHRARRLLREKVRAHCGVERIGPCLDCTCDAGRCCAGDRAPAPLAR